jgi:hypothetical protein
VHGGAGSMHDRLNQLHRRILWVLVTMERETGREKGDRKRAVGGEPKLRAMVAMAGGGKLGRLALT